MKNSFDGFIIILTQKKREKKKERIPSRETIGNRQAYV